MESKLAPNVPPIYAADTTPSKTPNAGTRFSFDTLSAYEYYNNINVKSQQERCEKYTTQIILCATNCT